MHDTQLSFLPFDNVWKMRIDHPYSLIVKDGGLAWSCGQCPLDADGAVLFPHDMVAQAKAVAGFIARYLGDMGCATSSIGRLVAYYVKTASNDDRRLKDLFQQAFGQSVQVIPVAVPHFYYEGMLIEVDVFASDEKGDGNRFVDDESGLVMDVSDAGPFFWVTVSAPPTAGRDFVPRLQRLLDQASLSPDALLAEQWFLPVGCDIGDLALSAGGETIMVSDPYADIGAALIFAKAPVSVGQPTGATTGASGLSMSLHRAGGYFNLKALHASPDLSLVQQTVEIMEAVETVFAETGLSFRDVRKATTHYVAGNSAEALHDNMSIRNRYYPRPGPASTGLPVEGLIAPGAQISISLFGAVPHHGG